MDSFFNVGGNVDVILTLLEFTNCWFNETKSENKCEIWNGFFSGW